MADLFRKQEYVYIDLCPTAGNNRMISLPMRELIIEQRIEGNNKDVLANNMYI